MIGPECNWTWRSTQYDTGHGALKTGVADGPWTFSLLCHQLARSGPSCSHPFCSIRNLGRFISLISAAIAELDELTVVDDPVPRNVGTTDFQSPQREAISRPANVKRHSDWRAVASRLKDTDRAGDKLTVADAPSGARVGEVFHRFRITAKCTIRP
jgi:hypothetical protein